MKYVLLTLFVLLTACTPNTNNGQKVDDTLNIQKPQEIHTPKQTQNTALTAKDIKHPKGETATPEEIAECQKQGGTISKEGLLGRDFCVVEFADKGKACSDGSDCQAERCIVENVSAGQEMSDSIKGICPSDNVPFGCYGTVNSGQLSGFMCVD